MAENLNPFEGEEPADWLEDEIKTSQTPHVESPVLPEAVEISWDGIASKLLKDNFILTALELHTELVESGRELPRLRDYFSNPGNFERTKEDTPSPTLRKHCIQMFALFPHLVRNKSNQWNYLPNWSHNVTAHIRVKHRLLLNINSFLELEGRQSVFPLRTHAPLSSKLLNPFSAGLPYTLIRLLGCSALTHTADTVLTVSVMCCCNLCKLSHIT